MIVGITGGIASGKSTVASFFKEWGAEVIDVDKLGWQVLEANQKEVVKEFGKEILTNGKIDRKRLGKIVFENIQKKKILDGIVHPSLIKELKKRLSTIRTSTPIVVDCALIYEWGIEDWFDKTILVTAPYETKLNRLLNLGYTEKEAKNRIQAQLPDEVKSPNWVVENTSTLKVLQERAKKIWVKLGF